MQEIVNRFLDVKRFDIDTTVKVHAAALAKEPGHERFTKIRFKTVAGKQTLIRRSLNGGTHLG